MLSVYLAFIFTVVSSDHFTRFCSCCFISYSLPYVLSVYPRVCIPCVSFWATVMYTHYMVWRLFSKWTWVGIIAAKFFTTGALSDTNQEIPYWTWTFLGPLSLGATVIAAVVSAFRLQYPVISRWYCKHLGFQLWKFSLNLWHVFIMC